MHRVQTTKLSRPAFFDFEQIVATHSVTMLKCLRRRHGGLPAEARRAVFYGN